MDMPTPCPNCDRVVELNDMNRCDFCDVLMCDECCTRNLGDCEDCKINFTCEYEIESGRNKGLECGKFAPNKIEDIRCCRRHFNIIERRLDLL